MSNGISGKVIIITGASGGLGEAAAIHLAKEGGIIVLVARREERLNAIAARIISDNGQAMALTGDVSSLDSIKDICRTVVETYGKIDVFINNAGIMPVSPLDRFKTEDWNQMIDINIKGVLNGIAASLPHMINQKSGHMINVSSMAGHRVMPGTAVYSATKFAVRAISEGLRMECKPHNIRSTVISPGAVQSDLLTTITEPDIADSVRESTKIAISPAAFAHAVAYAISQPQEVDINEIMFRPTQQVS